MNKIFFQTLTITRVMPALCERFHGQVEAFTSTQGYTPRRSSPPL